MSMHCGPPLFLFPSAPALERAGLCCWGHVLGTPQRDCGREGKRERKGGRVRGEGGGGGGGGEERERREKK